MNAIATTLRVTLAILLFSIVLSAGQRDPAALADVKKIYIESAPNGERDPQKESLTRELTKVGFEIVDGRSQADATLTGFPQMQIVVDGDGSIPDRAVFTYQLALRDNRIVWKRTIKFVGRRTLAEDYDYAAVKMAAKLLKSA